jgi:hypothetical protein
MNGRFTSVWPRRELVLALGGLLQPLERHVVEAQVDAGLRLELLDQVVDDALVEVLAAEVGVAVGALDLEHAVAELEDRDVEGAAAEVEDRDGPARDLAEAVGERGRGRLVDDALDVQPGDLARVLGGLALRVVEVGGHRDHGVGDRLAQELGGQLAHLGEHDGRDLLGRAQAVAQADPGVAVLGGLDPEGRHALEALHLLRVEAAPDQPLGREDRAGGVGDRLALGDLADELLALLGEGHDRGRGARALGVGDHLRLAAFHDRDAGVGRPEVDPDHPSHRALSRGKTANQPAVSPPPLRSRRRAFETTTRAGRSSRSQSR